LIIILRVAHTAHLVITETFLVSRAAGTFQVKDTLFNAPIINVTSSRRAQCALTSVNGELTSGVSTGDVLRTLSIDTLPNTPVINVTSSRKAQCDLTCVNGELTSGVSTGGVVRTLSMSVSSRGSLGIGMRFSISSNFRCKRFRKSSSDFFCLPIEGLEILS
jgi:hypothetical protein